MRESYVGFVITEEMAIANPGIVPGNYILRGLDIMYYDPNLETFVCKEEYDDGNGNCISPFYESNINTIKQAFGTLASDPSVCTYRFTPGPQFQCIIPSLLVDVNTSISFNVNVENNTTGCAVEGDGTSYCRDVA